MPTLPFNDIIHCIEDNYRVWKANTDYHPNKLRPKLEPARRNGLGNDLFTEKVLNNIGDVIKHNYVVDMFEQIFNKPSPDSWQRDALGDFIGSTIGTTSFQNLTILANACNVFHVYLESQPDNLAKNMSKFYEACRDFLNGIATTLS